MKDRFFYPLAALVIIGIISVAFLFGEKFDVPTEAQMRANGIRLEGEDLQKLVVPPANVLKFTTDPVSGKMIAILSTNMSREKATPSAGIFAPIAPAYKDVFAGQRLKITIVARRGSVKPLEEFEARYFQNHGPSSGWNKFALTSKFKDYTYYYTPKVMTGKPSVDYAGIWPGVNGFNETMELKSISVTINPK